MLTDMLQQYMVEKLVDERHPTIEYEHCTNSKQRKKQCTVCRDVCPNSVINLSRDVKWDACENCNICAVQCPSRAIKSSAINLGKLLELYQSMAEHVVISCRRREAAADLKLHCIASAPWEVIAYLALEKQVVFLKQGCEECEDSDCLSVVERTLTRVEEFLGTEMYRERIRVTQEEALPPEPLMTRRELFSLFKKRTKNAVGSVISDDGSVKIDGMVYRKLLTKRLKKLHDNRGKQSFGWSTRVFTESCWGCGICVKVCPQGAIEVAESGGSTYMAHTLWKCAGCGLCERLCREKGLLGVRTEYVTNPIQPVLTEIMYNACELCGRPVKAGMGKLCTVCAKKNMPENATMWRD